MAHGVFRFARNHLGKFTQRDLSRHHPGGLDHPPQYRICAGGRVASCVRPLRGHHSPGDICPLHQLAPCRGKPGCPHFRDPGSVAYRLCSHRRPAACAICPGPGLDVRPDLLCVLAFSPGFSRQFSIPGRVGRLHHRSGDRGADQPGQKDPWGCSFNRRIGIGGDRRTPPWCDGDFRRHHGLFCGTHRPV